MLPFLTFAVSVALATAPVGDPSEIETARGNLAAAVAEVDGCCEGRVAAAPLDAQRRWAYGLFRWLALSDGKPDWASLGAAERRLVEQSRAVGPEYAAVVAVHPAEDLERQGERLAATAAKGALGSLERFAEALYVLTPLEVERRRIHLVREEAVRAADEAFQAARREVEESRDLARRGLLQARVVARPFDHRAAFEARRATLDEEIAILEKEIELRREEFWDFEAAWQGKDAPYGSEAYSASLAEYEAEVERANSRILALTDRLVVLTKKRDGLAAGGAKRSLRSIPPPPASPAPVAAGRGRDARR